MIDNGPTIIFGDIVLNVTAEFSALNAVGVQIDTPE